MTAGGLGFRPERRGEKVALNVTPLIDVLFLLVIFFMLTGTFKRVAELELQLPDSRTAEEGPRLPDPHQSELVATESGGLLLDGRPLAPEELRARLIELRREDPEKRIILNAESGVSHGRVVDLLDAVREAGFAGLSLGTRPSQEP